MWITMRSRAALQVLLVAAATGIAFSWLLDTIRTGVHGGSTALAAALVLVLLAGAALTARGGSRR